MISWRMIPAAFMVAGMFALLGGCATTPPEEQALVITQNGRAADCVSPIAIDQLDGNLTSLSSQGFYLDPGNHSMNGTPHSFQGSCPGIRGNLHYSIGSLEADFEAGKTYYVGFDHRSSNKDDWGLIIWKVEDRTN